jgi:hypothetical protein
MGMVTARFSFPDLDDAAANEHAQDLLSEFKQDRELRSHLDLDRTLVARTDAEALDFGATLIAVLGTPAIIILARAVKSWVERTGTSVIEVNGVRLENVRSRDIEAIVKALGATGSGGA